MSPSNLTVEVWPVTDPGRAEANEDFVLVHQPEDEEVARYSGSLYVVADGQGGGTSGQIASRYAAQRVMYEYYNDAEPDLGLRLRQAISRANADLYEYARQQPELIKLGTTLVAAVVRGEQLHIATVGDSRAYLIREGELHQITRDHTLVQQLLDEGAITAEEAREHPRRDVVLRTVGSQPEISVDVYDARLRPDDALLLCTDGLTRYLHDDEITRIIATSSPRNAAETLVQKAVDRGGKDNVTVVSALVRAGGPPLELNLPHTWDESEPSLEELPSLLTREAQQRAARHEEPAGAAAGAGPDEALHAQPAPPGAEEPAGEATRRAAPVREGDTVPAPPYARPGEDWAGSAPVEGDALEAPAFAEPPEEGYEARPEPPSGYSIDPVTGLPPVPTQGSQTRQPYQPRIYQPPAQPETARRAAPQRGVSVGLFAAVGLIAILLTALMVVLLVNPMGWDLPVGRGDVTEAAAVTEPPVTEPAVVPTDPPTPEPATEEAAAPAEPTGEGAAPTVAPAPEGMVLISGGPFTRGVTDEEARDARDSCVEETAGEGVCLLEFFTDAQPVESVTISDFYLDVSEVTNGEYTACVEAGVCTAPDNTEFSSDPAFANHPVVYVNYEQATQYCGWAGKRLPTEAEWEKAARWDAEAEVSYVWPWGDAWEGGRANTAAAELGGLAAVEAFARDRSPYGALDMAGNVTEWVQDWYYPGYERLSQLNPARTGAQALEEPLRVARGGNYQAIAAFSRGGHRYDVSTESTEPWLGFRCAQDTNVPPPEPEATPVEGTAEATPAATPGAEGTTTP